MSGILGPVVKRARRAIETRCFSQDDLAPFDLLEHPVWVFDIENKSIWWANAAAVELWNADSLESLLQRKNVNDTSEAAEKRSNSYLNPFRLGGKVSYEVRVRLRVYATDPGGGVKV